MKISWKIALCTLLVTGCAGTRQAAQVDCPRDFAMARGVKDATTGHKLSLSFLNSCTAESRADASAAYREGYASAHPKHKLVKDEPQVDTSDDEDTSPLDLSGPVVLPPPVREPSAVSWVCEVEANSRVFTGVGVTRDEALDSARATCGSHFQASYCTKSDCKQNM